MISDFILELNPLSCYRCHAPTPTLADGGYQVQNLPRDVGWPAWVCLECLRYCPQ